MKHRNKLFFNDILTLLLEVYIEFLISIFLYWAAPSTILDKNTRNDVLVVILTGIIMIFVPFVTFYVSFRLGKNDFDEQ